MAEHYRGITDRHGNPIEKKLLKEDIAGASMSGVRSPLTAYPGDGLTPEGLASILRSSDNGNPVAYLELAETAEERDPHYAAVLGVRKRSVTQLEITVEAASEEELHQEQADRVREWLRRDELEDELFDMLDAIGKGYSFTEIVWETSTGQWQPGRLEWRDPRWFRFDRKDGRTPLLLDDNGQETPLPGFKFIQLAMRAKSGLPVRSGIARAALWTYLFKAYTNRDWAIFAQTYGQPVRVGKYGPNATDEEKRTLLSAVANIAADCAAIIPESMMLEFIEAKNLGAGHALYKERADWLDQQISKLVLGQTATTDAIAGGHAVSREHREVQGDIERADAKALAGAINRDLVIPWMALEYGPAAGAPRIRIGRAEQADVKLAIEGVEKLVPLGLKVGRRQMADLIGIGEPAEDDELLVPAAAPAPGAPAAPVAAPAMDEDLSGQEEALAANPPAAAGSTGQPASRDAGEAITRAAMREARPSFDELVARVREIADAADTPEEAAMNIRAAVMSGRLDAAPEDLEAVIREALVLGTLSGMLQIKGE